VPLVSWSTQQLVELLATVTGYADERSAMRGAIERAAEALEAEAVALVKGGEPLIAIGFPSDAVPSARLAEVADRRAHSIEVPGGGSSPATAVALDDPPGGQLVVARSGEDFRPEELTLLRGMGQVLTLSLRMLLALEGERALREESRRQAEVEVARLEHVALTDSLTGLRNVRAFDEDLGRELRRFGRGHGPLTLVLLDLDGLKQVNDALGHQVGDDHLKALAACLLDTARGGDAVYRVGGDEFAVVLVGESAWGGLRLAQRLQGRLAGHGRRPTVTAGVAELTDPTTKDALVRQADLALIEAKRSSRQALIYSQGMEPASIEPDHEAERHRLTTLATALARAVDAKDSYTRSHSETVAETCALVARELGLEPESIEKLRLAGLLHDVGKISIPDAVLHNRRSSPSKSSRS
jgi:diguanylate cyclase (GGDEF)-like protein